MKEKTGTAAVIFGAGFFGAFLLSRAGVFILSGLCLMAAAAGLYFWFYARSGKLLDMEALFSLFWLGGVGVSCLKLSKLAAPWAPTTWLCFGLAYVGFLLGYELFRGKKRKPEDPVGFAGAPGFAGMVEPAGTRPSVRPDEDARERRLRFCLLAVTGVSLGCFLLEAALLGFLPILSDKPHAYSEFHISGVHYFTVSCVLAPALALLYYYQEKRRGGKLSRKQWGLIGGCTGIAFLIPILCVSRFQLIFSLALAVTVWIQVSGKLKLKYILILAAAMVPLYVGLTVARNHDVAYLNGIFEMKNERMPIFVTQPYMYIANNYDNFNCLVEELPAHTHGLRMAYPLIVFSGMKFSHPEWVNFPLYVTKTELTTVTILYDAYYDFGVLGVFLFSFVLGLFCRCAAYLTDRLKNPVGYLFYAQAAMYLVLSFFTTWYSNPTTWFWYGVTFLCYLIVIWPGCEGTAFWVKDRLKHGSAAGFRAVYCLLRRTKASEKAEALRLYREGLAYLDGSKRPGEDADVCRITGGAYEYTFFNVCFAGDMVSAGLDVMSKGGRPRIDVRHPKTGENLWEQFFLQPFAGDAPGRRENERTVSCAKRAAFHPNFLSVRDPEECEIWSCLYRDFLRLNQETARYVEAEYRELFPEGVPVLGVLCRGTDYTGTKPKNHPIQPEPEEVIEKVREMLGTRWKAEKDFRIYLACDERQVEEKFRAAFPGKILVNRRVYYDETYRLAGKAGVIGEVHLDRERDDYYRGLEYLSSLILLSYCRGLVAGNCGGSNAAVYWNGGKYEFCYLFDKGFY